MTSSVIRFDDFELDIALFELRKSERRIPVEPQVFDLLVFLARNHDRTVTKEEIFAAIWDPDPAKQAYAELKEEQ